MSQNHIEQVKCPVCHYDSPMTVWNFIDGVNDPELKEKLLNGDIYDWKCEVCGHEAKVPFGTIYVDYQNRFMLFYYPMESEVEREPILVTPLAENINLKDFTLRKVIGINNLREKLTIFEAGLNDVAIERLKYFQKLDHDLDFRPEDTVYFLGIDTDPEMCKANNCERGIIKFIILREGIAPRYKGFPTELYFDYLLSVNKDPRMKTEDCPQVDWKWMDEKLRSNE